MHLTSFFANSLWVLKNPAYFANMVVETGPMSFPPMGGIKSLTKLILTLSFVALSFHLFSNFYWRSSYIFFHRSECVLRQCLSLAQQDNSISALKATGPVNR